MSRLLITWLVTTVSFYYFRPPIGIEIDSFKKAAISAAVFGILNALLRPILGFDLPLHYFDVWAIRVCFECNHLG